MENLTTRDTVAAQPMPEDNDILSAFALAPSEPEPNTEEPKSEDDLERFLKLARAH